jgi:hypothetical protein
MQQWNDIKWSNISPLGEIRKGVKIMVTDKILI